MINGATDFAEYANKIINGISCLYLAKNEIMAEPQDIETSRKIPRTWKVHKVLRTYNEGAYWQNRPVSHSVIPQKGQPRSLWAQSASIKLWDWSKCGYCKERYNGNEDWLECKLCDQWFHEAYFEK